MKITDDQITLKASQRFESLGQNCEMGFALRKIGNENGQLFRWAVVPINSITKLINNRPEKIYVKSNLVPCDHDMVRDSEIGISFHCAHKFEKQPDGLWKSLADPEIDAEIYEKDSKKFNYMYEKFLGKISGSGSIFVYKDISRPADSSILGLSNAIRESSNGGSALAIVYEDNDISQPMEIDYQLRDVAIVKMKNLVDNKFASTATYEVWHQMFRALDEHFCVR